MSVFGSLRVVGASLLIGGFVMTSIALAQGEATQGISSGKVVTLGTWVPRSGALAGIGSAGMDGAQLAFEEFNRAGGVNGYTIKMIEVDDGFDPGRTVAAARQLWQRDKVFAVFHPYGSGTTAAAAKFIVENNVPLLFPLASAEIFHKDPATQPPNVYGYYPFYDQIVYSVTGFAAEKLGRKKIGMVFNHGEFGEAGHRAFKEAAKRFGFEPGSETGYALNETNFVAIGRKIAASGDDATLLWSLTGGPQIMAAAEQAGYKGIWLIQTALIGETAISEYKRITSLANRIYLPHFQKMPNDPSPEIRNFAKKLKAEKPDTDVDLALMGYTNAKVFIEALTRATKDGAQLTWPKFKQALESIDKLDIVAASQLSYANGNRIGNAFGRIYIWDGKEWQVASDFSALPKR